MHWHAPALQSGVAPEQTAQDAPQWLSSVSEQAVHRPALHHWPDEHWESSAHWAQLPDKHHGCDVPSQRAHVPPQCSGSSLEHEVHWPPLHHLPVGHSVSNSQNAQFPAMQEGNGVPRQRAQLAPQWAGSSSAHVTHAPASHHSPCGQCVSCAHWTHMLPTQYGWSDGQSPWVWHCPQEPLRHKGEVVPVQVAHEVPQWSGSSILHTEQLPASHHEPDGQSPSTPHCMQVPPTHLAVFPEHAVHDDPQWASSLSEQVSHEPALHHCPASQFMSSPHCAHAPWKHHGCDDPVQREHVVPQWSGSVSLHASQAPALHHLP